MSATTTPYVRESRPVTPHSVFSMAPPHGRGDRKCNRDSSNSAKGGLHGALAQHHREDSSGVGAESHPHSELLRALTQ